MRLDGALSGLVWVEMPLLVAGLDGMRFGGPSNRLFCDAVNRDTGKHKVLGRQLESDFKTFQILTGRDLDVCVVAHLLLRLFAKVLRVPLSPTYAAGITPTYINILKTTNKPSEHDDNMSNQGKAASLSQRGGWNTGSQAGWKLPLFQQAGAASSAARGAGTAVLTARASSRAETLWPLLDYYIPFLLPLLFFSSIKCMLKEKMLSAFTVKKNIVYFIPTVSAFSSALSISFLFRINRAHNNNILPQNASLMASRDPEIKQKL